MKVISKIALLILIIALLYLLISGNLLSYSPFVIAGQLLAVGLAVWARRSFQAGQFSIHAEPLEGSMLRTGPYRYIRHPMYTFGLLLVWLSAAGHFSFTTVLIGLTVTGVIAVRIVTEEQFLSERFPEYAAYAQRTRRIIPFVV